jgi:hypothetical protein
MGEPLQRLDAGFVTTTLDPRDGRVAGADQPGEFLLGDSKRGSMLHHEPGKRFELGKALLLGTVGCASSCPACSGLSNGRADRAPGHLSSFSGKDTSADRAFYHF